MVKEGLIRCWLLSSIPLPNAYRAFPRHCRSTPHGPTNPQKEREEVKVDRPMGLEGTNFLAASGFPGLGHEIHRARALTGLVIAGARALRG